MNKPTTTPEDAAPVCALNIDEAIFNEASKTLTDGETIDELTEKLLKAYVESKKPDSTK